MNVQLLIDAGEMKPGPVLSQKLGPIGININEVIAEANKATELLKGMQVPITIVIDDATKAFEIEVSSPPMSGLIKKEAGIQKGSGAHAKLTPANLSIEQIIKIANTKLSNLLCNDLKAAVKITIGSCTSLGILVESRPASEMCAEVEAGTYDKEISEVITETPAEKKAELDAYFKDLKAKQDLKLKQEAADADSKK